MVADESAGHSHFLGNLLGLHVVLEVHLYHAEHLGFVLTVTSILEI